MAWYDAFTRGIALNIWAPEWDENSMIHFDAQDIARKLKQAGASAFYMWQGFSQDHFGMFYYPTRLGPVHPHLAKDQDCLRDIVDALHAQDIKAVGYYSYTDYYIWNKYPEWRQKDADGNDVQRMNFGAICPNSPYRELVIARLKEIAQHAPLDGLCINDSLEFVGEPVTCYCPYCERKYLEMTGHALPRRETCSAEQWQEFVQWRYAIVDRFHKECEDAIHTVCPELPLTHFCFALYNRDEWGAGDPYEQSGARNDFTMTIAGWNGPASHQPRQIASILFNALYLQAISARQAHVHIPTFMYGREYNTMPAVELGVGSRMLAAAAATPIFASNLNPDATFSPTMLQHVEQAFAQTPDYAVQASQRVADVALVFSKRRHDMDTLLHKDKQNYLGSIKAAAQFFMEAHVPFSILLENDISPETLRQYQTVCCVDQRDMPAAALSALAQWVEEGGSLLCSTSTACNPPAWTRRVLGVTAVEPVTSPSNFVSLPSPGFGEKLIHKRVAWKVAPVATDAACTGNLVAPKTEIVPNHRTLTFGLDVQPGEALAYPAIVRHTLGKGRVSYLAFDAFSMFNQFGFQDHKAVLAQELAYVLPQPSIRTELPCDVQLFAYETSPQERKYIFVNHGFHYSGTGGNPGGLTADGLLQVAPAEVRVPWHGASCTALWNGEPIPAALENGEVCLTLPGFECDGVLTLRNSAPASAEKGA